MQTSKKETQNDNKETQISQKEMQNDYKVLQNGQEKMQNGYRDEKWQQRDANKPPKRWKMTTKDLKTAKEKSTNDYKGIQNNQKEMQNKKETQNKLKVMPNGFFAEHIPAIRLIRNGSRWHSDLKVITLYLVRCFVMNCCDFPPSFPSTCLVYLNSSFRLWFLAFPRDSPAIAASCWVFICRWRKR